MKIKRQLLLAMAKLDRFDIKLAQTEEKLQSIYKFRYDIYIKKLSRKQKYADQLLKMIKESLDRIPPPHPTLFLLKRQFIFAKK